MSGAADAAVFSGRDWSYAVESALDASVAMLRDELVFQPAVQSCIWTLPADPVTFVGARAELLRGANSYRLSLPQGIPVALFWSVTLYDPVSGSGLDGEPFPSINTMDKPATNPDGSTDIYFAPSSPGEGRNWLRTHPDKDFFVILRLYGPTKAFYDHTWRPSDLEKLN